MYPPPMLVNCSGCRTPLQLPSGARSIRCALCQAITHIADPRTAPPQPPSSAVSHQPPPQVPAPLGQLPHPHGRKRAVICGISYRFSRHELKGCINDAKCMRHLLINKFKFAPDSILMLTEEETDPYRIPNKQNMRMALYWPRSSFKLDPLSVRAKESELRALYLLKQQQLALVSLLNRNSSNTIDESSLVIDNAISLSKEIEEVLLSPHRTGNSSSVSGLGTSDTSIYLCKKVDQSLSERRTIEWKPRPDKFLFAICLSGQMSNHLICLEKHMFFAALLDRVLVIPSPKFDYQYDRVIDIDRINTCLGRTVVVSFDQFKNKTARIDRFICYFSSPQPCYVDEEHVDKLKGLLGVTIGGKLEAPWSEDIKKPSKRSFGEVVEKFKSEEGVIAIGDVFYADLERDWVMQPGGPINHKCKTLIEPSRLILLTAQRFIQTFLGKNFIALHLRRHGFLKFCNAKSPSCFYPIPQAADCISRIVERANAPVIYLSTDAAESETGLLQSLVVVDGKVVPLVKRPPRNSAEKWDSLLYRHGIEDDSQVDAMLDKTICAMSSVFIGASGSTFTEDILRLRKDWGTSSTCDEYLCRGEEPNFIAEDE